MPSEQSGEAGIGRQLPQSEEIFLDHIGHFVRDPQSAAAALARAGFSPTPASVQVNPGAGGADVPTGTGNVCAMLQNGYVECLFKTADTPLGLELDTAMRRYPGVHLVAFSVDDAERAHGRLRNAGFRTRPIAHMRRPVVTDNGRETAAFTVVRVEPGVMPEGRIQLLRHHTEDVVWQRAWLGHPNGALGLLDVVIAAPDPNEATDRYARFLDRRPQDNRFGHSIPLDRGSLQIVSTEAMKDLLQIGGELPTPFIGLYTILVRSIELIESCLVNGNLPFSRRGGTIAAHFPEPLGNGAWLFARSPADLPWHG